MMKLSAKPISSPGRAEKYYPPPLMRFLRSNVGSRSRGRSRSSPMFIRKKNTAIETQEPTSPKVTCMGQVRVKRSKQNPKTLKPKPKHRCKWIHNTFFCHQFYIKPKPNCFTTSWPKCITFCHTGFRRKSKVKEEFSRNEAKFSNRSEDIEQESEEDEEEEEDAAKVYASTTPITPPKNALLLTRCRSAPYRSSSLAFKFWGSPLESEETEQKQSIVQETSEDESVESERAYLSNQELKIEQESEEKIGFLKEFAGSLSSISEQKVEDSKFEEDGNLRPLILTRCKSEPARRGERLDPEISFWKKRRLGFT